MRLDVRVREEEKEDWRKAAKKQGIGISELVRREMLPHTSQRTQKLVAESTK